MSVPAKEELARLRAEKIIRVQSGQMTAREAAHQLGVSRKTYYKWEKRLLSGMVDALSERDAGRPAKATDPEKESLLKRNEELEKEVLVLKQALRIREVLGPKSEANNPAAREHRRKRHSADAPHPAEGEKGGIAGQGSVGDRDACAKIDGGFSGDAAPDPEKRENGGTEAQAAAAPEDEYGLEKKRARQDG